MRMSAGPSQRSGDARDANQAALWIGEVTDNEATGRPGWTHNSRPAEAQCSLKRRFNVWHGNVEHRVTLVAFAAADATAKTSAIFRGNQLDEPVTVRIGDLAHYR